MSEIKRGRQGNLVVRRFVQGGKPAGFMAWFWCPGCEQPHVFQIPRWSFNGNYERPTFTPSLLLNGRKAMRNPAVPRCHLFLTDGVLSFLDDCTHKLAGQKVPLPEPPSWL